MFENLETSSIKLTVERSHYFYRKPIGFLCFQALHYALTKASLLRHVESTNVIALGIP